MSRKLIGGALGAVGAAAGVARHVLWYVSYRVDGTTRTEEPDRRRGSRRAS